MDQADGMDGLTGGAGMAGAKLRGAVFASKLAMGCGCNDNAGGLELFNAAVLAWGTDPLTAEDIRERVVAAALLGGKPLEALAIFVQEASGLALWIGQSLGVSDDPLVMGPEKRECCEVLAACAVAVASQGGLTQRAGRNIEMCCLLAQLGGPMDVEAPHIHQALDAVGAGSAELSVTLTGPFLPDTDQGGLRVLAQRLAAARLAGEMRQELPEVAGARARALAL